MTTIDIRDETKAEGWYLFSLQQQVRAWVEEVNGDA
jgi:hypothetical protein